MENAKRFPVGRGVIRRPGRPPWISAAAAAPRRKMPRTLPPLPRGGIWGSRGHRLEDRYGEALGQRGLHEHVAHRQEGRDVLAKAEEPHTRVDSEAPRLRPESGLTLTPSGDQKNGRRARPEDARGRLQQI